jgi:hypothetical protein
MNRDLHFWVDYWKLNDIMKKDCFPLPQIEDTLEPNGSPFWT